MIGVPARLILPSTLASALRPLVLGALILCAVIGTRHFAYKLFAPQDEGILLVYPDLILRGYLPYRDFAPLYTPGGFYLLAGLFRVFGETVSVERSLAVVYWFLIVLAIYLIGSRVSRLTATLAATSALAYLYLFRAPGAHPHFGAFACMLFSLVLASKATIESGSVEKRAILLAGIIASTTLWLKQDLGVIAIIATLVGIRPTNLQRVQRFLIGVAIPITGLAIFAIFAGPKEVLDSVILDPIRSAPGRFLPLRQSWDLDVVGTCIAVQCVIAVLIRGAQVPSQLSWLARSMATLSAGYSASMLHRTSPGDIGYLGFLVVSLSVVSVSILLQQIDMSWRHRNLALLSFFVVALAPIPIRSFEGYGDGRVRQSWISLDGRRVPYSIVEESQNSDLQKLLNDIERKSQSGEGFFVGPRDLRFANYNDTFIYFLLPRLRPVSRYLEMNPGCANRSDSGLTQEISRANWLILTTRYNAWSEPNASIVPGPEEPNTLVRNEFCLQSHYGDWLLYRRCGPATEDQSNTSY